jgi:UDP-N-acetylglucosamine transferase subunit ALG13
VTIGSDRKLGFARLIREMDEIAGSIGEEVSMQIVNKKYLPKNAKFFSYLPFKEYVEFIRKSDLIVAHCAAGAVLWARQFQKPIIVVPRQKRYGEHFDDHQLEFARTIADKHIPDVTIVYDVENLKGEILKVLSSRGKQYSSQNTAKGIIEAIKEYLKT